MGSITLKWTPTAARALARVAPLSGLHAIGEEPAEMADQQPRSMRFDRFVLGLVTGILSSLIVGIPLGLWQISSAEARGEERIRQLVPAFLPVLEQRAEAASTAADILAGDPSEEAAENFMAEAEALRSYVLDLRETEEAFADQLNGTLTDAFAALDEGNVERATGLVRAYGRAFEGKKERVESRVRELCLSPVPIP